MSQKKLQEYYKDVDTYNSLLNSSVSLFFKSILTYSIAALGLFFTLLVQFFKDRQITDNIINDVFIAVLLLSVCIDICSYAYRPEINKLFIVYIKAVLSLCR